MGENPPKIKPQKFPLLGDVWICFSPVFPSSEMPFLEKMRSGFHKSDGVLWKRTTFATSLGFFFLRKGEAGSLFGSPGVWCLHWEARSCPMASSRTAPVGLWLDLHFLTSPSILSLGMGCGFAFFPLQFSPVTHCRLVFIILSPGQAWRYFKPWWEAWREESQTHPQADKILSHELFFFSRSF